MSDLPELHIPLTAPLTEKDKTNLKDATHFHLVVKTDVGQDYLITYKIHRNTTEPFYLL